MLKIEKVNQNNIWDLNEVFTLYQEFYNIEKYKMEKESNISFFEEILTNPNLWQQFIVYVNNKLAWMITLYITYSSLSKMKVWILNDLYLKEEFRWKWYWKQMIIHSMDYFKSLWIWKMTLETHVDNFWAQKLYEKLGWEWEVWKIYEFIF